MHLEMSVSKILTHRHLWYFKTIPKKYSNIFYGWPKRSSVLRLLVPRLAAAVPAALGDANGRDANTIVVVLTTTNAGNVGTPTTTPATPATPSPSFGQTAGSGTTRAQTCNSCGDGVANEHRCPPARRCPLGCP